MTITKDMANTMLNWFKYSILHEGERFMRMGNIEVRMKVGEDNELEKTDMTKVREIIGEVLKAQGYTEDTHERD